jgi:hypothetical protein
MPLSVDKMTQKADFVFEGTVRKTKAATMATVPVDENTLVVHIDHILHSPDVLKSFTGKEITVQFDGKPAVDAGQSAVFFTNGWLFGSSVAVRAMGTAPIGPKTLALKSAAVKTGDPVESLEDVQTQDRHSRADLVVLGRVTSVHLPTGVEERISEHAPLWKDAVVKIERVFKGEHAGDTITVRFPGSKDIRWNDSPKFHVGQHGYFLLQKGNFAKAATAAPATPDAGDLYTALSPYDFQSQSQSGGIKKLIAG